MKSFFSAVLLALSFFTGITQSAYAWGRHDLITEIAIETPELTSLKSVFVTPEPMERAAPDLLKRVIPQIELWCERYHREHDSRYKWSVPKPRPELNPREALLWALEDNTEAKFPIGDEQTAADILIRYTPEPDGMIDEGLEKTPYIERMRDSMSYFATNDSHTHAFRHYYVPSSLIPPIIEPKGIAPYRADLYTQLAMGAFATGHPYWGFRFLAWSLHYLQDITQPWHTVFVPDLSFLKFSKSKMKHEIQALHYLTEAFSDSWIHQMIELHQPTRTLAQVPQLVSQKRSLDPWYVSRLAEDLAQKAHARASGLARASRAFFKPVVEQLGDDLKLTGSTLNWGGIRLASAELDFSGQGEGAAAFLKPVWSPEFNLSSERDQLIHDIGEQVQSAVDGSRLLIEHTINASPRYN